MDTIMKQMNEDNLLQIGVKKRGHRKKIMLSIERLRGKNDNINDDKNDEGQEEGKVNFAEEGGQMG